MRWKTFIMLGSLVMFFSACTGTPQNVSTPPISIHPQIVMYSADTSVPSGKRVSVAVSCKPGEQMLGGGFMSSDLFEDAASIDANYPSSSATWTVTGFAFYSFFHVEAQVYCLQTKLPLDIHIVQITDTPGAKVACPRGMVLLNKGFRDSQALHMSNPQRDGGIGGATYALCAASHVLSGQLATSVFNPHYSSHGYDPSRGEVACSTGQIATGGESKGLLGSEATGLDFASWSVLAGGDADIPISAICVIFHA